MNDLLDEGVPDHYSIMCECAVTECESMIDVARADYLLARSNPLWFLVKPQHVFPGAEETVEQQKDFWRVEKVGVGRIIAEVLEPPTETAS